MFLIENTDNEILLFFLFDSFEKIFLLFLKNPTKHISFTISLFPVKTVIKPNTLVSDLKPFKIKSTYKQLSKILLSDIKSDVFLTFV